MRLMPPEVESNPLAGRQLRRRRGIRAVVFVALAGLAALVVADHAGCFGYRGDDVARFDRRSFPAAFDPATIDPAAGITLAIPGIEPTSVRLVGVDLPAGSAPGAAEASAYLAGKLPGLPAGKPVLVRLAPPQTRDEVGRLRAYLYLSDADDLGLALVRAGLAYADRRLRHPFAASYEAAEAEARQKQRGLWKGLGEAQQPAWRREWLRERKGREAGGSWRGD